MVVYVPVALDALAQSHSGLLDSLVEFADADLASHASRARDDDGAGLLAFLSRAKAFVCMRVCVLKFVCKCVCKCVCV